MGSDPEPSRPGTVVTWVVHSQNRWSLLVSSFNLSSSLTLNEFPLDHRLGHKRGRSAIVQNGKAQPSEKQ